MEKESPQKRLAYQIEKLAIRKKGKRGKQLLHFKIKNNVWNEEMECKIIIMANSVSSFISAWWIGQVKFWGWQCCHAEIPHLSLKKNATGCSLHHAGTDFSLSKNSNNVKSTVKQMLCEERGERKKTHSLFLPWQTSLFTIFKFPICWCVKVEYWPTWWVPKYVRAYWLIH